MTALNVSVTECDAPIPASVNELTMYSNPTSMGYNISYGRVAVKDGVCNVNRSLGSFLVVTASVVIDPYLYNNGDHLHLANTSTLTLLVTLEGGSIINHIPPGSILTLVHLNEGWVSSPSYNPMAGAAYHGLRNRIEESK